MPYLKLLKLLYFAERAAIDQYGSPIAGDIYVSMPQGPVLSTTLNMIKTPPLPEPGGVGALWNEYIKRVGYEVELISQPPQALSEADQEIAAEVFARYGHLNKWEIVDLTHALPEWRDPGKSVLPIDMEDILSALGKSKEEAQDTLSQLRTKAMMEDYARR